MYEALVSFSGLISMAKGEVRAITDKTVVADLLRAGYIKAIKEKKVEKPAEEKPVKTVAAKPRKKKK